MPNVEVRDADGNLVHTYQIFVDEYGTFIKSDHVIDMAKMNAIDDELVPADRIDTLTFSVVE